MSRDRGEAGQFPAEGDSLDRTIQLRVLPTDGTRPAQPKEKCGIFGIWGDPDAARTAYLALFALQHRGQESAGIAVSNGEDLEGHLGMGLVRDVFSASDLNRLARFGSAGAIGHNRYSTAGGSLICNTQPLIERTGDGPVAVAHNGNLVNAEALRRLFAERGHLFHTTSDTEVMIHLLASPDQRETPDPLAASMRRLQGAFSVVFLFPDRIEAARDPWGWRPLVLGELERDGRLCPVVVSETVALDVIGARFVREVEPGEIVTLSDAGVESRQFAEPADHLAMCIFEHVYFASPASTVFGQNVLGAREEMGRTLAREAPVDADWVMPMPDSGRSAANGYAHESGIPYREAIVPNRYVGRTFIKPTQGEREAAVRLKLNIVREIVEGKRLIVVDDSIVRGTTTRLKMLQLREAGAREIHLRISAPPIRHPCHFGVDFACKEQLIANGKSVEEIRAFLGVDSLHFLSLEGLLGVARHDPQAYCTGCFSGEYRVDVEHPQTGEIRSKEQARMF
ncbi:MAG TPA: amidophosphoribosyltransferase [Phycisphaerales bacterium]|nr:amidophosphoribosyltransferase [Phycisphaerales bacterium]